MIQNQSKWVPKVIQNGDPKMIQNRDPKLIQNRDSFMLRFFMLRGVFCSNKLGKVETAINSLRLLNGVVGGSATSKRRSYIVEVSKQEIGAIIEKNENFNEFYGDRSETEVDRNSFSVLNILDQLFQT